MKKPTRLFNEDEKAIIIKVATNQNSGDFSFPTFLLLLEIAPTIQTRGYSDLAEFQTLLETALHKKTTPNA